MPGRNLTGERTPFFVMRCRRRPTALSNVAVAAPWDWAPAGTTSESTTVPLYCRLPGELR